MSALRPPLLEGAGAGYFLACVTILLWAGFMIVSRIGGTSGLTAFDTTALRIGTAAVVLAPWWMQRLLRPDTRLLTVPRALVFAGLAGLGYPLLAYSGFNYAPASHGAVLISGLLPFFTTLFAGLLLGERPSPIRVVGLGLIALGVVALLRSTSGSMATGDEVLRGDLMFIAASIVWSLFGVLLKRWQVRAFEVTLAVVCIGTLIYLPAYVLFLPKRIAEVSWQLISLQSVFQGILVVCVAIWTYTRATQLIGATRMAVMLSSVPAIGALLAVPILDESLTAASALGVALTTMGALIGAGAGRPRQSSIGACPGNSTSVKPKARRSRMRLG